MTKQPSEKRLTDTLLAVRACSMRTPTTRAFAATAIFLIAGLGAWFFLVPDWRSAWPRAFLYVVLLVNTYFSVRFFSRLLPRTVSQAVVDGVLVVLYLALALSIGHAAAFMFLALCIFVAANAKYALLLTVISDKGTVKRKILIDTLGAALFAAGLAGTLVGYEAESGTAVVIIFAAANVYLLVLHPMYPS
jgi:hypothetical protein